MVREGVRGCGMTACVRVCTIPRAPWALPGQPFCLQQGPGTLICSAEGWGAGDSAESQNPHLK